jgi:hypothetical protein
MGAQSYEMANSMRKRACGSRIRNRFGTVACVLVLAVTVQSSPSESVRAELIRLQDQYGLTLAWVDSKAQFMSPRNGSGLDNGIRGVSFRKRKVILLTDSLEAFRPDGFAFRDIPRLATIDLCWSHDKHKLAATMLHPPKASLEIFVPITKATQTIEADVEERPHFTSQCWSPSDKQVAYDSGGSVKIYQVGGDMPGIRVLAKGTDVTWSPDGEWIAFRDRDTYYAIHPNGNGRRKLFHNYWGDAVSALYWSPDSRIVAYVRELGFLQGGALDAEASQLRVRRLEDGSEDSPCPDSVDWYANYQWVSSNELISRKASNALTPKN